MTSVRDYAGGLVEFVITNDPALTRRFAVKVERLGGVWERVRSPKEHRRRVRLPATDRGAALADEIVAASGGKLTAGGIIDRHDDPAVEVIRGRFPRHQGRPSRDGYFYRPGKTPSAGFLLAADRFARLAYQKELDSEDGRKMVASEDAWRAQEAERRAAEELRLSEEEEAKRLAGELNARREESGLAREAAFFLSVSRLAQLVLKRGLGGGAL